MPILLTSFAVIVPAVWWAAGENLRRGVKFYDFYFGLCVRTLQFLIFHFPMFFLMHNA